MGSREHLGGDGGEAVAEAAAGVGGGGAVEVGAGAGGGGGGVVVLVGARGGDEDRVVRDAQLVGDDLADPRVHALAHFRRAGGDEDGAVLVDVDQGVGLVHRAAGEGDAEFHRGNA